MRSLIPADKADVGLFVLVEDRFTEIAGRDRALIPALAVEIVCDRLRLEYPAVAGEDFVARQAALLPGQVLQIVLRDIAAVAFRDQILALGGGRRSGSGRGDGRFGRLRLRLDRRGGGGGRIVVPAENEAAASAPFGFVCSLFAAVALIGAFLCLASIRFRFPAQRGEVDDDRSDGYDQQE